MSWHPILIAGSLGWLFIGCGAANPDVELSISSSGDAPLSAYVRLHVVVRGCDQQDLAYSGDFLAGQSSDEPITADVPPGTKFYAWVQGWEACEDTCVMPESLALPGDCVCFPDSAPIKQKMTAEGCSDWTRHQEGSLTLNIGVGPRIPGACPPSIADCID
ncbi:MAG: hypothetical protein HY791_20970 [Deltaproteobacteria bacterium]|nr:hypothetical protein [Deltaproteobacteria bacterium]